MTDRDDPSIVELIPALRAFARTFYRDTTDADDLVQDTLLKAIARFETFTPGDAPQIVDVHDHAQHFLYENKGAKARASWRYRLRGSSAFNASDTGVECSGQGSR